MDDKGYGTGYVTWPKREIPKKGILWIYIYTILKKEVA